MKTCIICASPRLNGNCDYLSNLISIKFNSKIIKLLPETEIKPCTACGYCDSHHKCSISIKNENDEADKILKTILEFEQIFFISPIYFYHLPANLKALIDRSQIYYNANPTPKNKICKIILLAAREKGEKLFEGAELSFKYFLKSMGFENFSFLNLFGLDKKNDLKNNIHHNLQLYHKINEFIKINHEL